MTVIGRNGKGQTLLLLLLGAALDGALGCLLLRHVERGDGWTEGGQGQRCARD